MTTVSFSRFCAVLLVVLVAFTASTGSFAQTPDILDLKPTGWKLEEHDPDYGGRTFLAPDGMTAAAVDHINDRDTLAEAAKLQLDSIRPYGSSSIKDAPAQPLPNGSFLAAGAWADDDSGRRTMGLAMARKHPSGRTWTCSMRMPMQDKVPVAVTNWLKACMAAADRGYFVYASEARTAAARARIAAVPVKAGAGKAIETTLLALNYITGVGGMTLPNYYPVVLFRDGWAVRNFEAPPGDIDIATFRKSQPDDVTRWTKTAAGFTMHWPDDEKPEIITFDLERPKTFPTGHRLNDYWKRLSGGGNTALGGDVSVAVSSGYRFYADGRFSTDSAVGGSAPGIATVANSNDSGTYSLNGNTLILTYRSGKVTRLSIYYGGSISDPVLWLGGNSYTN